MIGKAAVGLVVTLAFAACGDGAEDVGEELGGRVRENIRSLPGDASSGQPIPGRSLEAFVRDYQAVGFFKGEDADAVARRITRAFTREWGEQPKLAARADELMLLAYDRRRAWFSDIELDVVEGNDAYVDAFAEWSKIAAGDFEPREVSEEWAEEEGPVTIRFEHGGREHHVEAAGQGDFLDLCVLTAGINPLIKSSGRQFAIYRPDAQLGQQAFVMALTADERRALERRGWQFATPAEVRLAFGYGQSTEEGTPSPC